MSDLYDSLEDECDERKYISGPQHENRSVDCLENTSTNGPPKKYSFFLRKNSSDDESELTLGKTLLNERQRKHFLPKLPNRIAARGVKSVQNLRLQKQILNEQGLQLNNDGSITRSPRWEYEELPFIKKEYKNMQFQKKKTYIDNNILTNIPRRPEHEIISKCKGRSIENLSNFTRNTKQIESSYNMTDSMKEKMFLANQDNSEKSNMEKNFRKTRSETISSDSFENFRQKTRSNEKPGDRNRNSRCPHHIQNNSTNWESIQKQIKNSKSKIHGYVSNISLPTLRPKLNYSDRHKMENGFNVFHLKQFNKKVETDTNRSNFGDSVVEELPEVTSLPGTCRKSAREDEELFYQKLIEKDKMLKRQYHSARSEGPVYAGKLKSVLEERKNIFKCRTVSSAMKIDLDIEVDNLVNTFKKSPHFCCGNSSTKPSKVELALKGKTYGYLANARNIFRLKAQSEKKQNEKEKEENIKPVVNSPVQPKKVSDASRGPVNPIKTTSPSVGIFPNVKGGLPRYLDKTIKGSRTLSRTKLCLVPCEAHKKLILPEVVVPKSSVSKFPN